LFSSLDKNLLKDALGGKFLPDNGATKCQQNIRVSLDWNSQFNAIWQFVACFCRKLCYRIS
jgi:hypothetical protein